MLTLNELRELIHRQLIEEANVMDLANRQLDRVAIVSYMNGRMTSLIAISTSEIVNHEGVPIPKVLGLAQAVSEYDANYRLHRLYAENAVVSIVLLAAALEYWKSVFADYSVSPAAQQVIKRYFDQNKDNPALVEPDADSQGGRRADFLKAAYLGPVGFNLEHALQSGEKAINKAAEAGSEYWTRDDVVDMVKDAANNGFDRAYKDISKTRHSLDDLLRDEAGKDLLAELVRAIRNGGTAKQKALEWLSSKVEEVYEMMIADKNEMDAWYRIVQPALDKLNYEA